MDDVKISDRLRAVLDILDGLRQVFRVDAREDREVLEHELGRAETHVRHVLQMVTGVEHQ